MSYSSFFLRISSLKATKKPILYGKQQFMSFKARISSIITTSTSACSSESGGTHDGIIIQIPYDDLERDEKETLESGVFSLQRLQRRVQHLIQSNLDNSVTAHLPPHKVCLAIAGGGGNALSTLAATSGASQLLLEGTIAYDRNSYHTYVRKNSRSSSSISDRSSEEDSNLDQDFSSKKFSYTSMEAARLASMSALWRGMELLSLPNSGSDADARPNMIASTKVIGIGAASTLTTTTKGAMSKSGRPSFGHIVATRGDGKQICMKFSLNRRTGLVPPPHTIDNDSYNAAPPNDRFAQDVIVSHLIVQILEQFILSKGTVQIICDNSSNPVKGSNGSVIPAEDFPGVTLRQWSNNILTKQSSNFQNNIIHTRDTEHINEENDNDPVEIAVHRILSGDEEVILLLPNESVSSNDGPVNAKNFYLQPVVYPAIPHNSLIFPGSFNPLHQGHIALAGAAVKAMQDRQDKDAGCSLPTAVLFELSVVNADKPPLEPKEAARRISLFQDVLLNSSQSPESYSCSWGILLTRAPLFAEKVKALEQAAPPNKSSSTKKDSLGNWAFIIGADTMVRLLNPKYYCGDSEAMLETLRCMGVKFVVGGRLEEASSGNTSEQKFISGDAELKELPMDIQKMFLLLRETDFRVDISSTQIRAAAENTNK